MPGGLTVLTDPRRDPLDPDGGKCPLLTADEERELARRIKGGDRAALAELVNANLGLRYRICVRLKGASDLSLEDLMQEATIGLLKAAEGFDPSRGVRFAIYAHASIKGAVCRAVADTGQMVRTPARLAGLKRRLAAFTAAEPDADGGRLCEALAISPRRLAKARMHLPARIRQGERASGTIGFDPADPSATAADVDDRDMRGALAAAVAGLSPIEALVIRRRFGLTYGGGGARPSPALTIARAFRIPLSRVRKAEASGLAKLRGQLSRVG